MKTPREESPPPTETPKLADLQAGCVVGFGFMQQKSVSGKRVPVTEVGSYLFGDDSFVAYRLEADNVDINLIVADADDPTGTYLALSQRLEPRLYDALFPGAKPDAWFAFKEGDAVTVKPMALGTPQGWLTSRYALAVMEKGRYLQGDYRLRKPVDRMRLSRLFDYLLFVDEDNEYAIEVEKYEDGMLNVFATVYRPATDIGEITRAPKSPFASVDIIPHMAPTEPVKEQARGAEALPTEMPKAAPVEEPKLAVETTPPSFEAPKAPEVAATGTETLKNAAGLLPIVALPEPKIESTAEEAKLPAPEPVVQIAQVKLPTAAEVAEKTGSVLAAMLPEISPSYGKPDLQPANDQQGSPGNLLTCDLRLAGRLIDEAQRNQMLLSELVRKVIDLPARVREEVLIPFTLDEAEMEELARRYNLPATDAEGVRQQIVEDLRRFVGEKKQA